MSKKLSTPRDLTIYPWLATKQAAALLALHPDILRRLRREGGGPPFARIGRAVRYKLADKETWMRARTATSTADEAARSLGRTESGLTEASRLRQPAAR